MALRLVLDTNVWLDWLVFDDPAVAPIKAAVAAAAAEVFIDAACEHELERVLTYPFRKAVLEAAVQAAHLAACRRITAGSRIPDPGFGEGQGPSSPLPVCRDPDDQKFLELARTCRADFLISKDRALLDLARRKRLPAPFRIVTPRQFTDTLSG
jgi:putative PIN family toxin of toxin-antitoxin system